MQDDIDDFNPEVLPDDLYTDIPDEVDDSFDPLDFNIYLDEE